MAQGSFRWRSSDDRIDRQSAQCHFRVFERMTILYHHRTLLDGAEGIHIAEMIRAFESLGHQVTPYAPGSTDGRPGRVPALVRRGLPQGIFECAAAAHSRIERRGARRLLEQLRPSFVYKRHALNDFGMLEA